MKQRATSSSRFSFLISGFCLLTKSKATDESFLFLLSLIIFNSPDTGIKTHLVAHKSSDSPAAFEATSCTVSGAEHNDGAAARCVGVCGSGEAPVLPGTRLQQGWGSAASGLLWR